VWIKLAVAVILCSLLFWAGWKVCDWRWESKENAELKALTEKVAQTQRDWEADRLRWETASQITSSQLSNLETQKDTMLAALNGLKLTRTIKVEPNAQGECESVVLDGSFGLRWNAVVGAAATGTTTDGRQ
jgi:hypothetical protein